MSAAKPDYGIDAPGVVRNLFLGAAAGLGLNLGVRLGLWSGRIGEFDFAPMGLSTGVACAVMGAWMVYGSKVAKLKEREQLLDRLPWRGDETLLDVGCGRGLMVVAAARRLPRGKASGLDLWQSEDLSGNSPAAVLENARLEGVAERVEVHTGDMRAMPFADASFDLVVSNEAIHNVYEREGRRRTMAEIARVLRPGGRILLHDIRHADEYAADLAALGLVEVRREGSFAERILYPVLTFGSLRAATVTARRRA